MVVVFTGSLLVACAHFGSYVIGADIDYKLLHGIGLLPLVCPLYGFFVIKNNKSVNIACDAEMTVTH